MIQSIRPANASVYNALPSLGMASERMEGRGLLPLATQQLGPIFLTHGVQEHWGIYLLHHHWSIETSEIPGERMQSVGQTIEYLMEPVSRSLSSAYVPATLALRDADMVALEFSRTPFALEAFELIAGKPDFLKDVRAALAQSELGEHFGLLALKPHEPGRQWTEFTPRGERTSICRNLPEGHIAASDVIDASWRFSDDLQAIGRRKCPRSDCSTNCYRDEAMGGGGGHVLH